MSPHLTWRPDTAGTSRNSWNSGTSWSTYQSRTLTLLYEVSLLLWRLGRLLLCSHHIRLLLLLLPLLLVQQVLDEQGLLLKQRFQFESVSSDTCSHYIRS